MTFSSPYEELVWWRDRCHELEAENAVLKRQHSRNYRLGTHTADLSLVWSRS